jgi:SGNH domain (fused to AT3 domains)
LEEDVLISYAAHLWSGLQTSYPSINFLQATAAAVFLSSEEKATIRFCSGMMKYIYEEFLPRAHLDGIIISARWGPEDIQAAIQTAQAFLPYADRVFLFGPLADYDQALPRILARAIASGKSESKLAETHRRADSRKWTELSRPR